jgi:hypothetical protein
VGSNLTVEQRQQLSKHPVGRLLQDGVLRPEKAREILGFADSNFSVMQNNYQLSSNSSGSYYTPSHAWNTPVNPTYMNYTNQKIIYDVDSIGHPFYQDIPTNRWISIEKPTLILTDQQMMEIFNGDSKLNYEHEYIEYTKGDGKGGRAGYKLDPLNTPKVIFEREFSGEWNADDYLPLDKPWDASKVEHGYRVPIYPAIHKLAVEIEKTCALGRK